MDKDTIQEVRYRRHIRDFLASNRFYTYGQDIEACVEAKASVSASTFRELENSSTLYHLFLKIFREEFEALFEKGVRKEAF